MPREFLAHFPEWTISTIINKKYIFIHSTTGTDINHLSQVILRFVLRIDSESLVMKYSDIDSPFCKKYCATGTQTVHKIVASLRVLCSSLSNFWKSKFVRRYISKRERAIAERRDRSRFMGASRRDSVSCLTSQRTVATWMSTQRVTIRLSTTR